MERLFTQDGRPEVIMQQVLDKDAELRTAAQSCVWLCPSPPSGVERDFQWQLGSLLGILLVCSSKAEILEILFEMGGRS